MIPLILAASLAAAAPTAADFGFLAGSWEQVIEDRTVRETWLAPLDGVMAGAGQSNRKGRPPVVEHMKISDEPAGVTFTAIILGQEPTPFVLKSWQDGRYVFENPTHDMPQRVIYWRCDPDLCARIEGVVNGEEKSQDWRYRRITSP